MRRLILLLLLVSPAFGAEAPNGNDRITLREYVDARFDAQERALNAALASAKEATEKADAATEKRFDSVNEFRKALDDNNRLLLTRNEYTGAHQSLVDKIELNTKRVDEIIAKDSGMNQGWLIFTGIIIVIGSIISTIVVARKAAAPRRR